MAYKDKDKQKQAQREWIRQKRATKGSTKGITKGGIVIPDEALGGGEGTSTASSIVGKPANFGQPDCQCQHCQGIRVNSSKHLLNHGPWKPASELGRNELNRVSLPGDADYSGVC